MSPKAKLSKYDEFEIPDLPDGWTRTTLAAISMTIQYGYTASAVNGSPGPRFLRITDIQEGNVDWTRVPTCAITESNLQKYHLRSGDIVFARTGATTGKSFLLQSCPDAVFASYLIRLRLLSGMEPGFIAHFLQTAEYWQFISENVAGNAQPNCNASKLAALSVPLAPQSEQRRISVKLEQLLARVESIKRRLRKTSSVLSRFRQAVLVAACSGKLTEDVRSSMYWRELTLGDIAEEIRTGPFGSALHKSDYVTGGIPVINPTNLVAGKIVANERVSVSRDTFRRLADYALQIGDIVIARRGEMGRCAVVTERERGWLCGTGSALLRLKRSAFPYFVQTFISSSIGREYLSEGSVGSTMDNLNQKVFAALPISLPSVEEQREIVHRVEALFKLADAIEKRVTAATLRAERLTQAVLAKAFRGELVPIEAELARREGRTYEPASALLERIKSARARLSENGDKRRKGRK